MKTIAIVIGAPPDVRDGIARAVGSSGAVIALPSLAVARAWLDNLQAAGGGAASSRCGDFEIDVAGRRVLRDGDELDLADREVLLLSALLQEPRRVWKFAELLSVVWGHEHSNDSDMVRSAVKRLRRRLRDVAPDLQITSIRSIGFRLDQVPGADPSCLDAASDSATS